jgi:hypothetical protein
VVYETCSKCQRPSIASEVRARLRRVYKFGLDVAITLQWWNIRGTVSG